MTYSFNIRYKGNDRIIIMFFIILLYLALPLWLLVSKNVKKVRKKKRDVEDTTFSIEKVPKTDVIVIGSNVSGLACAAALSKAGHKVLVLEKEDKLGGSFVYTEKAGCIFETSYQDVGSLIRTRPLIDWLTEKQIWWSRITDKNNAYLSVSDTCDFYNSFYTTRRTIKQKKLWKHVDAYEMCEKKLYEKINDLYIPERLCCILQEICCRKYIEYKNTSTIDFLTYFCDITEKKEQQHFIAYIGTGPIDVLEKIDCTVLLDKLLHYKHGAYYNVTGSKGIVNELKHTIEYHGGTILTKANVSSVKKEGVIVVNEHEISAKYIVSSLPYHKTQELIPHIEQIAEVKTLYKKIYGLLSVENYKHVDKMIVQDDSIIRCSSNKMNKNEEEKNSITFEMVTKDSIDKEKISETFVNMLKDYKVEWADIKTTTLPLVHYTKNLRPYTSDKQIYVCGKDIVHTKGLLGQLEAGYKTANVLCGYGTLIDIVTSRELMYDI